MVGVNKLIESQISEKAISQPPPSDLKFISMYANLDRMLKKLPESAVEDLNLEFIKMTYAKLKEFPNY